MMQMEDLTITEQAIVMREKLFKEAQAVKAEPKKLTNKEMDKIFLKKLQKNAIYNKWMRESSVEIRDAASIARGYHPATPTQKVEALKKVRSYIAQCEHS